MSRHLSIISKAWIVVQVEIQASLSDQEGQAVIKSLYGDQLRLPIDWLDARWGKAGVRSQATVIRLVTEGTLGGLC